jgi:hypothetical protein
VLELGPGQWSLVEVLVRRSHTCIVISGIGGLENMSRGSSTHELTRLRVASGACAKARVVVTWRCKART